MIARASLTAIVAITVSGLLGVGADPTSAAPVLPATNDHGGRTSVSRLVDSYETHSAFRGSRNDLLPKRLDNGIALGDVTVRLGSSGLGVQRDGYVDYGSSSRGQHIIAASDGPNLNRFGVVIENRAAPTHYQFDVRLPADAAVENRETGEVRVTSSEGTTTLAPARAVDARGAQRWARYRIVDHRLLLDVDVRNAAFPVLVDPVSSYSWWGTTTWYSRGDVRWSASWYGVIGIAAVACNYMPGWAQSACRSTVGRYTSWIYNTWMAAKYYNQCLWMQMTWTGQVIGIGRYSCNWG